MLRQAAACLLMVCYTPSARVAQPGHGPSMRDMSLLQASTGVRQRQTLSQLRSASDAQEQAGSGLVKMRLRARTSRDPEQLEAYEDGHSAYQSSFTADDIDKMVGVITPSAYKKEHVDFINSGSTAGGLQTRYIGQEGNKKAGDYIRKQFQDLGYKTVVQGQAGMNLDQGNIIGYKKGSKTPNEFVVLGAHFDSVNWEDTSASAPGAEDNASGAGALLQVARAMKDVQTDRSVAFIAFNAEEEGTKGSEAFMKEYQNVRKGNKGSLLELVDGDMESLGTLKGSLIMDEVAYPSKKTHFRRAILETKEKLPANVALVDTLAKSADAEKEVVSGYDVNFNGFGSDHITFLDAGIPAVLLIERDNMAYADEFGHSARDVLANTDEEFGAGMARLAGRAMLALASPKKA